MTCAEVQDHLWELTDPDEGPGELRAHLSGCSACTLARGEISRIREELRSPAAAPERVMAGVMARLSRPRPSPWRGALRYAAGLVVGITAALALSGNRVPEVRTVVIRQEAFPRPLDRLLARFENEPAFEGFLIRSMNEFMRHRSRPAVDPVAMASKEVIK